MNNAATELFLLMSSLSQVNNSGRIISIFTEALNCFSPNFQVEFRSEYPENEELVFEITFSNYNHGYFLCKGDIKSVSDEFPALFQNSVQMLAVILERLRQENLLSDESNILKSLVNEKTKSIIESETKYRSITENTYDLIALTDLTGRIIFCNRAFFPALGYLPETIVGSYIFDIVDNEFKQSAVSAFSSVLKNSLENKEVQLKVNSAAKNKKWISLRGRLLFDNTGNAEKVLFIARDITEQKLAYEQLNLKSLVINQISDNVTITDMKGVIIDINNTELKTIGFEREELLGKSVEVYGSDPVRGATQKEILENTLKNGSWRGEVVNYNKKGEEIILDCKTTVIFNEEGIAVALCGIAADITESKKTERKISSLLERLDIATRGAKLGIWDWNISSNHIEWDERMFEIFDIPQLPFIRYHDWLNFVYPEDRFQCNHLIEEAIEGKRDFDSEYRIVTPSGEIKFLRSIGVISKDEDGNAVRMTGVNYDITEQKQAENERKIMIETFDIINKTNNKKDLAKESVSLIKRITRCEAIGFRLERNGNYPFYESLGMPEDLSICVNTVIESESGKNDSINEDETPIYECLCGNILGGVFKGEYSNTTEHGSFWINNSDDLPDKIKNDDIVFKMRNRCFLPEYESTGLIPVKAGSKVLGLIQIIDKRKNLFDSNLLRILERISDALGIALLQYKTFEALQASGEIYGEIMRTALNGFCRMDPEGRILSVNQALCGMMGYNEEELIGMNILNISAYNSYNQIKEILENLANEGGVRIETKNRKKTGEVIDVEISAIYSPIEGGQIFSFITDISDRKRNEEELKQSYKTFYDVINSIPTGLFIYEHEEPDILKLIFGNSAAEELSGKKVANIIGKDFREIWPDENQDRALKKFLEVFHSGKNLLAENVYYKIEEKPRVLRLSIFNIPGNRLGSAFQDISQIKEAEAAVKESEIKFRSYIENAPYGVFIADKSGRFLDANPAMIKMLGAGKDELFKRKFTEISAEHFEERAINMFNTADEEKFSVSELQYVNYDNSVCWWTVALVKLGGDRFLGYVNDITVRKISEEQIKTSLKEKEVLIRELYHRTKNNMQVICAILKLKSAGIKDNTTVTILTEMENRIRSMALVHQKLYQSQNLSRVNLKEYILELSELLTKSYKTKNENVDLELELEKVEVLIDTAIPCGLIINELVSNSFKYAFPDNKAGKITIGLHKIENNDIELYIYDNGIGMNQNYDISQSDTLGHQIVFSIARDQMQGDVSFDTKGGVYFCVRFKDSLYTERV
jgi:PAS domain S-box-containing protein